MKQSTQRILTTHVGSLPRPSDLLAMIQAKEQGEPFDAGLYANRDKGAVAEAIAQRISRFAGVVGRDNVIVGADCGFASFSTFCEVHPSGVWTKLAALAEGARIASSALWGRALTERRQ